MMDEQERLLHRRLEAIVDAWIKAPVGERSLLVMEKVRLERELDELRSRPTTRN